jgi:hypothetical protein
VTIAVEHVAGEEVLSDALVGRCDARAGDGPDQLRLNDARRMNALVVWSMFMIGLRRVVAGGVIFSLMYLVWIVVLNRTVADSPAWPLWWLRLGWGSRAGVRKNVGARHYGIDG